MNQWCGIGRICKDFELKKVGSKETENCSFPIAVDRKYKSADGSRQADFITIVCWGSLAKFAHSYFQKGSRILVIGSIQSGSFEGQDGKKVYTTDIIASELEFVDTKKDTVSTPNSGIPASGDAVKKYAPPEIDGGFYPALDPDTVLPFDL